MQSRMSGRPQLPAMRDLASALLLPVASHPQPGLCSAESSHLQVQMVTLVPP